MSESAAARLSVEQVQALLDASPFIAWLGLTVIALDHDKSEIRVRMPLKRELERRTGTRQFHGGPIASFIDIVGDFAIGMQAGGGVPTMNLRIDYLRPAVGDALTGIGRVRRAGRTTAVIDVDVLDMPLVPGCVSAEPNGMSYPQLRDTLTALAEHTRIVGFDVVEVNPLLDVPTGITSYLAAHTTIEFLCRIADQPRWKAARDARAAKREAARKSSA